MTKYFFVQNTIKTTFLIVCLLIQINCDDLTQNNKNKETFTKYKSTFNTEIKKKFSIITDKINSSQYNLILKMKYYEIKIKYESISKTISLLEKLIIENNWDYDNENKFNNEIENFEKNSINFNSLYKDFNRIAADHEKVYQKVKKFLKLFFTILFIIVLIILTIIIVISFFVIRSQQRYHRLNEEVSIHADIEKNSETSRIKQNDNEKREENIEKEPRKYYGSSLRNEIDEITSKKLDTNQTLRSERKK